MGIRASFYPSRTGPGQRGRCGGRQDLPSPAAIPDEPDGRRALLGGAFTQISGAFNVMARLFANQSEIDYGQRTAAGDRLSLLAGGRVSAASSRGFAQVARLGPLPVLRQDPHLLVPR